MNDVKRIAVGVSGIICIVLAILPWCAHAVAGICCARLFTVPTGSMAPAVPAGSVACVSTEYEYLYEGDIIAFRTSDGDRVLLHRISRTDFETGTVWTKGDANPVEDCMATDSNNVIGVMRWSVPYLGYAIEAAGTGSGKICAFTILGFGTMLELVAAAWPAKRRLAE